MTETTSVCIYSCMCVWFVCGPENSSSVGSRALHPTITCVLCKFSRELIFGCHDLELHLELERHSSTQISLFAKCRVSRSMVTTHSALCLFVWISSSRIHARTYNTLELTHIRCVGRNGGSSSYANMKHHVYYIMQYTRYMPSPAVALGVYIASLSGALRFFVSSPLTDSNLGSLGVGGPNNEAQNHWINESLSHHKNRRQLIT